MHLLLLGGTTDARNLAENLYRQGLPVIYSVAGLVRKPQISCASVSGGFSQFGGLSQYIKSKNIAAILDATHPYAVNISTNAIAAAKHCGIPCWRFERLPWLQKTNDNWHIFDHWNDLIAALHGKQSVFFTTGQLPLSVMEQLQINQQHVPYKVRYWLRTATKPTVKLPAGMRWIKAIGPFDEANERQLMQACAVDALVCKNSGGNATVAKLYSARVLGIAVYMLKRPTLPAADKIFFTRPLCERQVFDQLITSRKS